MSLICSILNVALPPLSLILLPIIMLPYLFFKLLIHLKKLVYKENMARKVVLITGAASGIGEQLAYEYARKGAKLSLVDIREENLVVVAEMARSLGSPDVINIGADVSVVQDSKRFVDETIDHFGQLDHLVNNAGIGGIPKLIEDCSDATKYTSIIDINFWGTVHGTLHAIPHLKKSKGRIIVIASGCGWFPLPRLSPYNASKAAVISFFETLRIELGWCIGITIVTPGFVKTKLASKAYKDEPSLRIIPMGSAFECAKDIVNGACRGDMYVTSPSWVKVLFPFKVLYPELVDWVQQHIFGLLPNHSCEKDNLHMSKNSQVFKSH
ncbi:11-beta-hydroxysteroid dehydrogenase-like 4A [Vicia villosa]|uniref:11-beta-hydroxysteroid dehydrogenase-like 4A n=1 Tax=Vicia villosa TaxID=3911 RepID=UPI00273B1BB6|nr:11-beta-hydroxysteroid dehydrogenase-like 4A [Vicia villosa]